MTMQPVLQCVQVKPLPAQNGAQERFRVVFSDMRNYVQSMLATRKYSGLPCPVAFSLSVDAKSKPSRS